jgi:hypothetical protein
MPGIPRNENRGLLSARSEERLFSNQIQKRKKTVDEYHLKKEGNARPSR